MKYVYRSLWALGAIPVHLICCILFVIGLVTYPLVGGIYYIIHGTTDTMKWEVDTMALYIEKKYNKIKEKIEKENDS